MIDRKSYLSLSALLASDPSLAEFVKNVQTSTIPDDGRTGQIVITGRTPQLVVIDELSDLEAEQMVKDFHDFHDRAFGALEARIAAAHDESDLEPTKKRKSYASPYGPQRGRKQ